MHSGLVRPYRNICKFINAGTMYMHLPFSPDDYVLQQSLLGHVRFYDAEQRQGVA